MIAAALIVAAIAPCTPVAHPIEPAKIVWRAPMAAKDAILSGNILFVEMQRSIRALDVASGRLLWDRSIAYRFASGRTEPMVVAYDRIYVAQGQDLLILSARDGSVVAKVPMGRWIWRLYGPPLVMVARNVPMLGATLYSLDKDGRIRAKRIVRMVEAMWIAGGTIVAHLGANRPEDESLLAGFRIDDLRPLWSFPTHAADLQQIDGRWYFGITQWNDMQPLDPATGKLGPPLPSKEIPDALWGGATWEIDTVIGSRPSQPPCERLRVSDPATGKPRIEVDLPFAVTSAVRRGDRVYAFGEHKLAKLNVRTGKLERIRSGIPIFLESMWIDDRGLLIGIGLSEGAIAIRID